MTVELLDVLDPTAVVGLHAVAVLPPAGGASTDISCLVDLVTVRHGRDDTDNQPEAATVTIDFTVTPDDPLPDVVEVGATLRVATGGTYRFVGRISDITLGWEDAGEDTPDHGVGQITAASGMADLGRRVVGDAPWPQELDGARVARIMAAAGVPLNPATSDPGTVQILGRDVDSQPALDLARGVAADSGGLVWHTRDGQVRYADAEHRRNMTPALTLDACNILVTPTWRRTLEGLINDVSVGYGVAPEGGEQPRYYTESPVSKGRYGFYGYTVATQLAALADAQAFGNLLVTRNSAPVWIMTALPVLVDSLTDAEYAALLTLEVGSLINLTGLPAIGSTPTTASLWVEGLAETLAYGVHDVELAVSGYCRTVPPPRWDDLDPTWSWDALPVMTWDDAACLGPNTTHGRWADVSASKRWNTTPPATTWDTWKG